MAFGYAEIAYMAYESHRTSNQTKTGKRTVTTKNRGLCMKLFDEVNLEDFRLVQFEDGDIRVAVTAERGEYGPWVIRVEEADASTGLVREVMRQSCLTEKFFERKFNRICDLIRTDGRFWLRR